MSSMSGNLIVFHRTFILRGWLGSFSVNSMCLLSDLQVDPVLLSVTSSISPPGRTKSDSSCQNLTGGEKSLLFDPSTKRLLLSESSHQKHYWLFASIWSTTKWSRVQWSLNAFVLKLTFF